MTNPSGIGKRRLRGQELRRVWKMAVFQCIQKRKIGGNYPAQDRVVRIPRFFMILEKNMIPHFAQYAIRTAIAGGSWKYGTTYSWNTRRKRTGREDMYIRHSRIRALTRAWGLSALPWCFKEKKRCLKRIYFLRSSHQLKTRIFPIRMKRAGIASSPIISARRYF